jgi:intraflagellar transport protein 74
MDSGKLNHYQELVRLSMQMQEKYQQQVSQVDAIGDQIAMLQSQRESNTFNQDYKSLESQAIRLHKKMQSLTEELDIMKLEPEEMQKRMVAKVRADNSQAQSVDECIRVAKEDLRKSEQVSAELSADLEDRNSGGNSEKDKYEKLYARDNDMTESINKFDGEKKELDKETEETQNRIVKLLAHISTGVESQSSMPTEARAKEMSEEATFKEKQLESSQATMARLQAERQQRLSDIDKITNLDEKIKLELGSLSAKMAAMQEEMIAFDDLEYPRRKANETKAYLQEQMENYKKRTRISKEQVAAIRRRYDDLKADLSNNETYKQMETNEGRLRKYAQTIFNLNEFVESKGRETDFEALKENCMSMTSQLNNLVKDAIIKQTTNLSEAPISSQFAKY